MTWEPTNEFRWIVRALPPGPPLGYATVYTPPATERVLQQKWELLEVNGDVSVQWRDIPEVTEEGGA
jgi:hypothetical protein